MKIFALPFFVLSFSACGVLVPVEGPVPTSEVQVTLPQAGSVVTSPLNIEGSAPGPWFFEASLPVTLEAEDGTVLARGAAQAQSSWQTVERVEFMATLEFDPGSYAEGVLIFEKDNPSGLPEHSGSYEMGVRF